MWLLCGKLGYRELPTKFYSGNTSDCGVPYRLLPYREAYRIGYVGKNYNPVEHCVKEFVVTEANLQLLLKELQSVQGPDSLLARQLQMPQ